ncbi:hypothetical protein, partial [Rubrivivax gelatinosus]|uniref:hypothetical protein n=1 Tax=Rubrivivax gelatinosus TaxID=28068 RepID=UPI0005C26454
MPDGRAGLAGEANGVGLAALELHQVCVLAHQQLAVARVLAAAGLQPRLQRAPGLQRGFARGRRQRLEHA